MDERANRMLSTRSTISVTGALALVAVVGAASCSGRSPRYNPTYSSNPYGASYGTGAGYGTSAGYAGGTTGYAGGGAATAGGGATTAGTGATAAGAAGVLQAVDQVLRAQSYQPVGSAQRAFSQGETYSFQMLTQPGSCYTVLAVGDTGAQDVDLAVISPSGSRMGEDREPDTHPAVSFCPYEYGVHLARVTMYQGAANVSFVVYQGRAGTTGSVAAAFGSSAGASTATASAPGTPDPSTGARIEALRTQLAGQGYQAAGNVSGYQMRQGQTDTWRVNLQQGWCYSFATFGGPGVRDSDIFLYDGGGASQIEGDAGTSVDAVIRDICPTQTAQYQLRPRLYSGTGTVWFMPMARRNAAGGATSAATVTQTPLNINTQGSGGGLESLFRNAERDLVARGYVTLAAGVARTLTTGATQSETINLQARQCYAIMARGDASVQNLDMVLLDAAGNEVDRDRAQNAQPVVRVCPQTSGQFSVRMTMTAGEGQYRFSVYRWNAGTSGAGMEGLLFVRNAELTRMLQADNYQGDADFDIFRGRIREGAATNRTLNVREPGCYAVIAVGGAGVNDLNLSLMQGRTAVSPNSAAVSAFPEVRFCTQQPGTYQASIRSRAGSGEFVFRVFRLQASANRAGGG